MRLLLISRAKPYDKTKTAMLCCPGATRPRTNLNLVVGPPVASSRMNVLAELLLVRIRDHKSK